MVLDYYNLREQPFGVTPDSRYLYSGASHREALASLLYGVEAGRGFVALIAPPGMGKTTLLFHALNQLRDKARTVFLFQTICTPADFLGAILTDLGIYEAQGSLIELQSKLNNVLIEQSRLGKPLVVIIDEAQNLDGPVLELVRMLSNFETAQAKLLQVVLSGQPQLAEKLASPELVQLRQRVSIVAKLKPFSPQETALYIDHRLQTAGYRATVPLFTRDALALIAKCSAGIPRNINNLCFNALSLGCATKRRTIDCDIVREVVADLDLEPLRESRSLDESPEKRTRKQLPGFVATAAAPWMPASRLGKLAIGSAVLLVLAGALFASHRWAGPEASVRANSVVPALALAASPSARVDRRPPPAASVGIVRVMRGQTLSRICTENFGSCDAELLQEIRGLNPSLSDPDHIEPGQRLRVPVVEKISGAVQHIPQPANVSSSEKGTQ